MGRFGHRLFDHDQAVNTAMILCQEIAQDSKAELAHLVVQTISHAPHGVVGFYFQQYEVIANLGSNDMEGPYNRRLCWKLEAGLGDELFKSCRSKIDARTEPVSPLSIENLELRVIMLAALMMRYGAKIKDNDLEYIRKLLPTIPCAETAQQCFNDLGFRGPGKRQFQAALDNYQPGKARDFSLPSCHACGKWNMDIAGEGKVLMKCGGCQNPISAAWFCDKDCQKSLWKTHKQGNCGAPRGLGIAMWQAEHKDGSMSLMAYDGAQV